MSNSAVVLDGVTLSVGGRAVLKDISLTVGEAEFVGVLGSNGAGKTTLFRAILGLQGLGSGTISVFGSPVRRGNPAIGYLPQVRSQPPTASLAGRDFLACPCSRPSRHATSTGHWNSPMARRWPSGRFPKYQVANASAFWSPRRSSASRA